MFPANLTLRIELRQGFRVCFAQLWNKASSFQIAAFYVNNFRLVIESVWEHSYFIQIWIFYAILNYSYAKFFHKLDLSMTNWTYFVKYCETIQHKRETGRLSCFRVWSTCFQSEAERKTSLVCKCFDCVRIEELFTFFKRLRTCPRFKTKALDMSEIALLSTSNFLLKRNLIFMPFYASESYEVLQ